MGPSRGYRFKGKFLNEYTDVLNLWEYFGFIVSGYLTSWRRPLRIASAFNAVRTALKCGGMAERLKAAVLKTVERLRVPWVRILLPPPLPNGEVTEPAEGACLLSKCRGLLYRGFESLPLRWTVRMRP